MSVFLSTLRDLARALACGDHQAETVVREERSARAALSRRRFFQATGAVAAGVCLVTLAPPVAPLPLATWRGIPFPPPALYGFSRRIVYSSSTGIELHVNGALVARGAAAIEAIALMDRDGGWR